MSLVLSHLKKMIFGHSVVLPISVDESTSCVLHFLSPFNSFALIEHFLFRCFVAMLRNECLLEYYYCCCFLQIEI